MINYNGVPKQVVTFASLYSSHPGNCSNELGVKEYAISIHRVDRFLPLHSLGYMRVCSGKFRVILSRREKDVKKEGGTRS